MTRSAKPIAAVAAVAVAAAFVYIYYTFDPSASQWMPRCPSKLITGLDCPGCGSQRALHALLHGDIAGAINHNALFIPAVVYLVMIYFSKFNRQRWPRLYEAMTGNAAVYTTLAVIVIWGIVRNLLPVD